MEKFEKSEEEKLRAESMMDEADHKLRKGNTINNSGNIFSASQRIADIYKDSEAVKKAAKNEVASTENEELINKRFSKKSKPKENIWKN